MKIGKSVVNFTLGISSGCKYSSIAEVPYWSLYSQTGDPVENETGHLWRSDRAVTFAELKQYLEHCPDRRLLNAYPRKSANRRTSYTTTVRNDTFDICDKWTGEIYATFVITDGKLLNTYLANDTPSHISYYRKVAAYQAWLKNLMTYDEYLSNLPCKANIKNKVE